MKFVFVINPIAGNDNKRKIFSRIKSTFRMLDNDMGEVRPALFRARRYRFPHARSGGRRIMI